jgi:hypothetical protein
LKTTGAYSKKADDFKLGLLLGLIAPLLVLVILYFLRFDHYAFPDYLRAILRENGLITFCGVWITVANIGLLTFFFNTKRDQSAKGVFIMTLIFSVLILLLKFLN